MPPRKTAIHLKMADENLEDLILYLQQEELEKGHKNMKRNRVYPHDMRYVPSPGV